MNNSTCFLIFSLFLCISFKGFSQDLGENLAFGKETSQSTTDYQGDSYKAVDGNTSGSFDNDNLEGNSVTHTEDLPGSWWRVDLGEVYALSVIRIYNRSGGEGSRLLGAEVYLGPTDSENVNDYIKVGDLTSNSVQYKGNLGSARFVMIRQNGILSLAEVEVYAYPTDCPPVGNPCDDGNPHTINDVEDGDCNCVGTVVVCEDVYLSYQVNDSSINDAPSEITVGEGDNIGLFLELEGIEYTVTDPSNEVIDPLIENITSSQSGQYLITPKLNPMVISVDSEEIYMEDGRGSNAVDGDEGTIWHTEWSAVDNPYPHDIVIDLRTESYVSGLTYLPRQDNKLNGMISEYEIYVSNSTTSWGSPVASAYNSEVNPGTHALWEYDADLKEVAFTPTQGRYVRLVALSEGGGNTWASAAEITVTSEAITPCIKTIQINVGTAYIYDGGIWTPSDPNIGSVGLDDSIRINSGDAVISNNISCYGVSVAPGAGITINSGVTLAVETTTLQSRSNTYSSLILNGEITGLVNYERHVNIIGTSAGGGNDLISAPVANQTFGSFATATANAALAALGTLRAFAPYNTSVGAYQNYDITANASTVIASGMGFRAATTTGSNLSFTGSVAKSNVQVTMSDASLGRAWNLIGNPYPSYLHFRTFFNSNMDEFESGKAYQAIYGYNGGASNQWEVWNLATSNEGDLIAPGQGFFVKAKTGAGNITFTPAMRRTGTSDDFIAGRPASTSKALSKLKLSNASNTASTSIYFIEGTTKGLDRGYDAAAYSATKVDFSMFTNLLEDHTGLDIAVQSLPYNDFNNVIVPLGIKAKAGAELSISIDELSTLPSNINVYLEDTQYNTLTLLNDDVYTFKLTANLNGADRFNIHYSAKTLSVTDIQSNDNLRIYTTVLPKALIISGQLTSATTAHLYDLQGRLVLSQVLNPSTPENTMDISTMSTGVYVIKLNNDNQIKAQKLIIK